MSDETVVQSKSADLGSTVGALLMRYWLIAFLTVFLGAASGFLVSKIVDPVYRAQAIVAVSVPGDGGGNRAAEIMKEVSGLASFAGIPLADSSNQKDEVLAYVRGRDFLTRFIVSQGLKDTLAAKASDGATQAVEHRSFTNQDAYQFFVREVFSLREDKQTGLITVSIDWSDPVIAADWVNDLIEFANADFRNRVIVEAEKSQNYLKRELEVTTLVELRQSIFAAIESQVHRQMVANVRDDYAFRVIDPALPSDEDKPVRPRTSVSILIGIVAGSALFALFLAYKMIRTPRSRAVD